MYELGGKMTEYPDMPESQKEWEFHWAMYKLAIAERDREIRCNDILKKEVENLKEQVRTLILPYRNCTSV